MLNRTEAEQLFSPEMSLDALKMLESKLMRLRQRSAVTPPPSFATRMQRSVKSETAQAEELSSTDNNQNRELATLISGLVNRDKQHSTLIDQPLVNNDSTVSAFNQFTTGEVSQLRTLMQSHHIPSSYWQSTLGQFQQQPFAFNTKDKNGNTELMAYFEQFLTHHRDAILNSGASMAVSHHTNQTSLESRSSKTVKIENNNISYQSHPLQQQQPKALKPLVKPLIKYARKQSWLSPVGTDNEAVSSEIQTSLKNQFVFEREKQAKQLEAFVSQTQVQKELNEHLASLRALGEKYADSVNRDGKNLLTNVQRISDAMDWLTNEVPNTLSFKWNELLTEIRNFQMKNLF